MAVYKIARRVLILTDKTWFEIQTSGEIELNDISSVPAIHHPTKFGPFTIVQAGEFQVDPNRKRFLVEDWWGYDSIGLLVADPKTGKTWFALMLAFAIASGQKFLNRFEVQQGPVIMFSPEGNRAEFHDRVRQVGIRLGIDPKTIPLNIIEGIPQLYLDDASHQNFILEMIKVVRPALVIFDPLEKSLKGGFMRDEEVKPATDFLNLVRTQYGCSFMVCHHTSKGDARSNHARIKGAGLLFSFGDCYIYLNKTSERVFVESEHKNFEQAEPFKVKMSSMGGNSIYEFDNSEHSSNEKKLELDDLILQFLAENYKKAWPQYKIRETVKRDATKYPAALNRLKSEKEIKSLKGGGWKITAKGKQRAIDSSLVEASHFPVKKEQKTAKKAPKKTTKKQG